MSLLYEFLTPELKAQIGLCEEALLKSHPQDKDLFPLLDTNEVDSFIGVTKINRIVDLQFSVKPTMTLMQLQAICYEIFCLRQMAKRGRQEHQDRERATRSKSTLTNLAALTTMVAAVGAFAVSLIQQPGGNHGKS